MKSSESKQFWTGENKIDAKEIKLTKEQILNLIAETSHKTWMKQANRDKGTPMNNLSPEVSEGDRKRASDVWAALEAQKPATREAAVDLLAKRSHEMWLESKRVVVSLEPLDLNPTDHDRERAEDIIKALEAEGVPLSFRK